MEEHYYIYHIPGVKVGCTKDFKRRMMDQGYPKHEILEIIEVDSISLKDIGDIEHRYADQFGYPKGTHYMNMRHNLTEKDLEKMAASVKKSSKKARLGMPTSETTKRRISLKRQGIDWEFIPEEVNQSEKVYQKDPLDKFLKIKLPSKNPKKLTPQQNRLRMKRNLARLKQKQHHTT